MWASSVCCCHRIIDSCCLKVNWTVKWTVKKYFLLCSFSSISLVQKIYFNFKLLRLNSRLFHFSFHFMSQWRNLKTKSIVITFSFGCFSTMCRIFKITCSFSNSLIVRLIVTSRVSWLIINGQSIVQNSPRIGQSNEFMSRTILCERPFPWSQVAVVIIIILMLKNSFRRNVWDFVGLFWIQIERG